MRRRRYLVDGHRPGTIQDGEVGEGSPNIDPDPVLYVFHTSSLITSMAGHRLISADVDRDVLDQVGRGLFPDHRIALPEHPLDPVTSSRGRGRVRPDDLLRPEPLTQLFGR